MMKSEGSLNRLEWVLGVLLVVLLVVVVALSLLFWLRPSDNTAVLAENSATVVAQAAAEVGPTPAFEGYTAKFAFVTAQKAAASWAPDAKLLNATATWSQGATAAEILAGETTWAFTFYSRETSKSATISVVEDSVNLLGEANVPVAYNLFDVSAWELDSDDVIRILLDQGGRTFLETEGITVLTMALLADDQSPSQQMEWMASLIATQNGRSLNLRVNATNGEILELTETP